MTIHGRKQDDKIEQLSNIIDDKDKLIEEFRNKLSLQVSENATLNDE